MDREIRCSTLRDGRQRLTAGLVVVVWLAFDLALSLLYNPPLSGLCKRPAATDNFIPSQSGRSVTAGYVFKDGTEESTFR